MLKEIKNPTLEVEINNSNPEFINIFYTSKKTSLFPDDEHELCYKEMNYKKFAGHGSCLGFADEKKETICCECWHYIPI